MIDLLQSARAKGEAAVKRAVWAFAAAGLIVLAAGFAAASVVEALKLVAPAWAALALGATFLLLAGWLCQTRAQAPNPNATVEGTLSLGGPDGAPAGGAEGDWRALLNDALIKESRDKPARAAAIAAIAGLILGAIEGLDDRSR
ncbi:MAG: hypothetical protein HXY23_04770 [Parvularculaceae bacterium]|nr:hypothetical protein [Parvularculaceae bacterium]